MNAAQAINFDPKEYIADLKGKDYLPVAARIAWFRIEHPTGSIDTEPVMIGNQMIVKARVILDGVAIASGMATVRKWERNNEDRSIEKAETAAIGRALGVAGFGTLQAGMDLEEGEHLSDSPQPRPGNVTPIVPPAPAGKVISSPLTGNGDQRRIPPQNTPVGGNDAPLDVMVALKNNKAVQAAWNAPQHGEHTINKMWREQAIHADMSDAEMVKAVVARLKRKSDAPEGELA